MNIKKIIIVFSLILCLNPIFSQENTKPKPYEEDEFSQVFKDIRRFEIITFGALPFVTLDTMLIYSTIRWANNGFSGAFPNPFASSEEAGYSNSEITGLLVTAVSISFAIALTDYLIHYYQRSKTIEKSITPEDIYILPQELNPPNSNIKKEE